MNIFSLCDGRHDMPACVQGSIFGNSVDPTDIDGLQMVADRFIGDLAVDSVAVYVTGLTVALVAVINACHKNKVKLTLMHFNRATGDYMPQVVM